MTPWTLLGVVCWKRRVGRPQGCPGSQVAPLDQLHQRRLVAVLGDIDALRSRLWLEALRQGLRQASHVAIQQRFKGVGMRWSEDGFNHLLHLRLGWVNGRFDKFFSPQASPNRAYAPSNQG